MYQHNRFMHDHLVHERQSELRQEAAQERLSHQARADQTDAPQEAPSGLAALAIHVRAVRARLRARLARRNAAPEAPQH